MYPFSELLSSDASLEAANSFQRWTLTKGEYRVLDGCKVLHDVLADYEVAQSSGVVWYLGKDIMGIRAKRYDASGRFLQGILSCNKDLELVEDLGDPRIIRDESLRQVLLASECGEERLAELMGFMLEGDTHIYPMLTPNKGYEEVLVFSHRPPGENYVPTTKSKILSRY